jgi:hypothetical protein
MSSGVEIRSRIFIVGCPRSGTTLLQSMLASHPEVVSFPETHYFSALAPKPWWRLGPLIPDPALAKSRFEKSAELLGSEELKGLAPTGSRWKRKWVRTFAKMLDGAAVKSGASAWIEKTPEHLSFCPIISRYIEGVRFIHILRDGKSVVSSLVDVTRKHPEHWGGVWDVEKCVGFWNRAVLKHRKYASKPGHMLVRYETLAAAPEPVLLDLCTNLGIEYCPSMLEAGAAGKLVTDSEAWKSDVQGGSKGIAKSKFETVLTAQEQELASSLLISDAGLRGLGDD